MKRTGFIGGSDCVKIMQGDWQTLWEIKTGRKEPEDLSDNIAVQLGSWTESFNLSWFEKQHGCVLSGHQYEYEQIISTVACRGTVDARWNNAIVEAKHTNAFNKMDDIVELYMPQIQLYAHLAKADGTHLSVIFGNSKWESTFVHYNNEYFNSMWAVVSDFWSYVLRDEQPTGVQVDKISTDSIALDNMVKRDASRDNQFMDAAVTYLNEYEHNRVFENAKKTLKQMVGPEEREVYCDQLAVRKDKRGALRIVKR